MNSAGTRAERIIKVNHAGEFGAVNIYRAQIQLASITAPSIVPTLREFIAHERRHLEIFGEYLTTHSVRRCRSYWLCGLGGYALGFVTALMGRSGIMACTAAVESVVTRHLMEQMRELQAQGETDALHAVASIVEDEVEHQQIGVMMGRESILYKPLGAVVAAATAFVIWLGMKL